MHDPSLLNELLVLVAVATAGAVVFERMRLPSIAGFLVVGTVVGPGGLGLIGDPERVRTLAEFGVVFLLFEVGLELPIERVRRMWRQALLAGGLQVAGTVVGVALVGSALGLALPTALVMGGLVAMSSTAIVMRLLSERGEIDAPHGQLAVGVLLFQDLCIVPFLLCLPILASGSATGSGAVVMSVAQAAVALAGFGLVARFALPRILEQAAQLRSGELFAMVAVVVVFGSAVIAESIGLSLAVGAFVGGLALSATPYAHQLHTEVIPLRGLLLGVFFTAIGMLFDPGAAAGASAALGVYLGGVVVGKALLVAGLVTLVLRQGVRNGVRTGLALAQTGEFSFVLAAAAAAAGLLEPALYQVFVSGSIATLLATPFLVAVAPGVAGWVARGAERIAPEPPARGGPDDHVVLVGFGLTGRTLARVLRARGIPYRAVDANASAVQEGRGRGEPVVFGDASRKPLLVRLGVARARLVAVAISDPVATREVVSLVRSLAPRVPILVRTHYVLEVDPLERAGASRVVAEEFESTLEFVGEALQTFGVPREALTRFAEELRSEGYELLRAPAGAILDPWLTELLEGAATRWVEVGDAFGNAATLADLDVRARTGTSIVAVDRGGRILSIPAPDFAIEPGDRLLAVGSAEAIGRLEALLAGPRD